jgi:hypothetical protein
MRRGPAQQLKPARPIRSHDVSCVLPPCSLHTKHLRRRGLRRLSIGLGPAAPIDRPSARHRGAHRATRWWQELTEEVARRGGGGGRAQGRCSMSMTGQQWSTVAPIGPGAQGREKERGVATNLKRGVGERWLTDAGLQRQLLGKLQ